MRPVRASISRLPEDVANQIAAGEVVERPVSVVKELVENALDAGARRVDIEIEEGGKEYIRVRDDGWGIPSDEVELAFERHATSKIRTADELFAVVSLGFRGEALPSIASVSELELRTRVADADSGVLVRIEGGRILEKKSIGCPVGTTVSVRRLFFNTPARYRFLKSAAAERRHIVDWVSRIAVTHLHCAFTLTADGRQVLKTSGSSSLDEAIAAVFGRQAAEAMLPVSGETATGKVWGQVSRPDFHRGNRELQVIAVNGRPIASPMLSRAVEKAYETLLPSRRFPAAVLHLQIDPLFLDVNVHPAKLEVKFADEREVFRLVLQAVRQALSGADLYARLGPPRQAPTRANEFRAASPPAPGARQESLTFVLELGAQWSASRPLRPTVEPAAAGEATSSGVHGPYPGERPSPVAASPVSGASSTAAAATAAAAGVAGDDARQKLRHLELLGYLDDTFVVGVSDGELWIVDQHVAHERLLYERLLRRWPEGDGLSQRLLHPVIVELTTGERDGLGEALAFIGRAGFDVEMFGPRSIRVTAVPAEMANVGTEAIAEALRELVAAAAGGSADRSRHHMAARMACKLAVKAGERLPLEAVSRMLYDLSRAENPFTCPHGRPIVVVLPRRELERRFGRI